MKIGQNNLEKRRTLNYTRALMISSLLIAYALSADLIHYDGKTVTFSHHFLIEHPLGRLSGEKASLTNLCLPPNKTSPAPPCRIQLENQIQLDACNAPTPFFISSERARCDLPPKNIFSAIQLQEIEFYENVVIKTPFNILAKGGSALYCQNKLSLYPSASKSHCSLERNQDWIHAEKITLDLSQREIICLSAKGYAAEKALFFSADSLRISLFKNFRPALVFLEGRVAVQTFYQNKKSFCSADSVIYKIEENEWFFSGAAGRKVLFWQDGLELSAPQLRITDAIEGIGDVHFKLNKEEKKELLQIFSK